MLELGQRYTSGAVLDDGTDWPEPDRDPELYHQPTTHPGAKLPRAWLQHGARRVSILDLCGMSRWTLITGIGGAPWRDAAVVVAAELSTELDVRTIGLRCEYEDVYGDWARQRDVSDAGCLLIRPDGHVAWRRADLDTDPRLSLREAVTTVLAHSIDEITQTFANIATIVSAVQHDYAYLNFVHEGYTVVVEGTSSGRTADGTEWQAGLTHAARWCDVFEIRDHRIQRLFIYLDPDYAGADTARCPWLTQPE